MATPMLTTKLYLPPSRPNVVPRPRLIEQLDAGLGRKLTLISAPAGFGKSTVVSTWIAARKDRRPFDRVAWLALDERDSDPNRFLAYLIAALQTVVPGLGAGVAGVLQSPQPPQEPAAREVLLTALLNEISAIPANTSTATGAPAQENAGPALILILDDYHLLESSAVDQALTFLLDHLPPQLQLVIVTREDPSLPLARYRVRGQLTEVRASDLRFTLAEAAAFLNQVMGLTLAGAEIAALESRTEGWIAGLQLAALSLQGRADTSTFIQAFTGDHHFILDYLIEEVLQHQPARVRSFLLQTAILDRLSGPLCAAVTAAEADKTSETSRAMLEELARNNLFVIPLDDKRQWYRYHHLFADVLQARAMAEQPDQVPLCHRRASDWYEEHGLRADAIRHALAAKDFGRAAALIELAWPEMDGRFQSATWLGWAKALPADFVHPRPVLSVAYGWALLNCGALEAAEEWFGLAERWLDPTAAQSAMVITDATQWRILPASLATARAYQTQARGDIPSSVKYGQQALTLLAADDHQRRGPAAALLALAQWANGDLEDAYQTLATAMANFQKVGNLHFALSGTYGLGDIRTVQGRLHDAIKIYQQVLTLALTQGEPLLRGTAELYLGLSELYLEQGALTVAQQHLLRSEELGEKAGLPNWHYRHCRVAARFKASAGDLVGALDRLDAAEGYFQPSPVPDVQPLAALRARVWIAQGRLQDAQRWVQVQGLSVDDDLHFLREFEHITLARLLIAQHKHSRDEGSLAAAMALLARLLHAAEGGGRCGSVIEILVLQAVAYAAQGNLSAALAPLERALTLAEPEGYVRRFVDEGLPMAQLLAAVAAQGILPAYTGKLLAALGTVAPPHLAAAPPAAATHSSALIEPLSERELEVLQLLGTALNGPEIAQRLMVSLNTMRTHTKNIFSKLGVNNRRAAVQRAAELHLL